MKRVLSHEGPEKRVTTVIDGLLEGYLPIQRVQKGDGWQDGRDVYILLV